MSVCLCVCAGGKGSSTQAKATRAHRELQVSTHTHIHTHSQLLCYSTCVSEWACSSQPCLRNAKYRLNKTVCTHPSCRLFRIIQHQHGVASAVALSPSLTSSTLVVFIPQVLQSVFQNVCFIVYRCTCPYIESNTHGNLLWCCRVDSSPFC